MSSPPTITGFLIPAAATSWTQVKRQQIRNASEIPGNFRFHMYSLLNCRDIETCMFPRFDLTDKERKTICAFIVTDEEAACAAKEKNILLSRLGLPHLGAALIIGGIRLRNKALYRFASLSQAFLSNTFLLEAAIQFGWQHHQEAALFPSPEGTIVSVDEHAEEWHAQSREIQQSLRQSMPDNELVTTSRVMCQTCHKSDVKLKSCGNCRAIRYCSATCQKADWSQHKIECNTYKELYARERIVIGTL